MNLIHVTRTIESDYVVLKDGWILGYFCWSETPESYRVYVFENLEKYLECFKDPTITSITHIEKLTYRKFLHKAYSPMVVKTGLAERMNEARTNHLNNEIHQEFVSNPLEWGAYPEFDYDVVYISNADGHVLSNNGEIITDWFVIFVDVSQLDPKKANRLDEYIEEGTDVHSFHLSDGSEIISVKCDSPMVKAKIMKENMAPKDIADMLLGSLIS